MEEEPKEIVLKPSRIYFLGNYIIAGLVFIFLILLYITFNFSFTLFPKTQSELISTMIFLGIFGIGVAMIEQPEWERFRIRIIVTMNDVVKEEGILKKHRISLPYGTVADARIERSPLGRIFNYGTLIVSSFKEGSDMKMHGIRDPVKIHTIIQNRVNKLREGQLEFWEKQSKPE